MTSDRAYDVSTKVLIDQGRQSSSELKAKANKTGTDALQAVGCDVPSLISDLDISVKSLQDVESKQERLKVEYLHEAKDDRDLAEKGYRWILRTHSRIRLYLAENAQADEYDLRTKYRFGKIRVARARSTVYELRILLPELRSMKEELRGVGVTPDFIKEGENILSQLETDREETEEVKAKREKFTRKVHKFEVQVSRLLRRLELSDEAAALEHPDGRRWFPLDIIAAEQGRIKAARDSRITALPEDPISTDESDS